MTDIACYKSLDQTSGILWALEIVPTDASEVTAVPESRGMTVEKAD